VLGESLTPPLTKAFGFLNQKVSEAEIFTCRACNSPYTDGSDGGSGSKKNYGFCSSKCRRAPQKCEHGLKKSKCKDCGTGDCQYGLWKSNCRDCGAGRYGRKKSQCKDCGTDTRKHVRQDTVKKRTRSYHGLKFLDHGGNIRLREVWHAHRLCV
jgi:hypothetical protein